MMRRGLALFGGLLLTVVASPAVCTVTELTDNCYYCKYLSVTGPAASCRVVPDGATGNTICREDDTLPFPAGPSCSLVGDACFNTVVTGIDDGSGGGVGRGCTVSGANPCPPSCGSCNRTP